MDMFAYHQIFFNSMIFKGHDVREKSWDANMARFFYFLIFASPRIVSKIGKKNAGVEAYE